MKVEFLYLECKVGDGKIFRSCFSVLCGQGISIISAVCVVLVSTHQDRYISAHINLNAFYFYFFLSRIGTTHRACVYIAAQES